MNKRKILFSVPLFLLVFFLVNFTFQACSLKPNAWFPSKAPSFEGKLAKNEILQSTEWIDLQGWYGAEDIAVDKKGNLYCGVHRKKTDFSDGAILKIDTVGRVTVFCKTDSWVTGLHFDKEENLIACDLERGLISVNKTGKITILASKSENNSPFLIPNDIDIASDGIIYFSNTSSTINFSRLHARKIILEMQPDGGLYSYNPTTKTVKTLIDGAFFGNGVAISKDEDFVLMVDLAKYRVMRYWIKGKKQGTTDVFIDNLIGFPNGIARRKDGSFWLGFTTIRNELLDNLHPHTGKKKLLYGVPLWLQPKQEPFGIVMNISEKGEILTVFYDTTGKKVSESSSIEEHNGYLYLGGDLVNHIGKFKLPN
ncbi:SMP-30/gluconolactonase/LRE family protein [Bernardetia sp. OM2101]|uniref:SMP-30/gluconolactonase/LRE family protein n=1 Tax=Bernardetia sp. OM2101 TaxID=3344876 RepID=UPI0035D0240F